MFLKGNKHQDQRGIITYNNDFDAGPIKRVYTIENNSIDFVRGWQGHKIERRWFACMRGSFQIAVVAIDDFEHPNKGLDIEKFILTEEALGFLAVPARCMTAIKAMEDNSKLIVFSDYPLGVLQDEYRLDLDYFDNF